MVFFYSSSDVSDTPIHFLRKNRQNNLPKLYSSLVTKLLKNPIHTGI